VPAVPAGGLSLQERRGQATGEALRQRHVVALAEAETGTDKGEPKEFERYKIQDV